MTRKSDDWILDEGAVIDAGITGASSGGAIGALAKIYGRQAVEALVKRYGLRRVEEWARRGGVLDPKPVRRPSSR